ncbi:hypothetical protein AGIG_G71 [Arapaima gigas]
MFRGASSTCGLLFSLELLLTFKLWVSVSSSSVDGSLQLQGTAQQIRRTLLQLFVCKAAGRAASLNPTRRRRGRAVPPLQLIPKYSKFSDRLWTTVEEDLLGIIVTAGLFRRRVQALRHHSKPHIKHTWNN